MAFQCHFKPFGGAFAYKGWPEIVDFGVLEKYRKNGTIYKWETGRCLPDINNMFVLKELYKVSLESIYELDDEPEILFLFALKIWCVCQIKL